MANFRRLMVSLGLAVALAAPVMAKPRLVVEPGAGVSRIFVVVDAGNGEVRRSLLRVTSAAVVPGTAGEDPAGRAANYSVPAGAGDLKVTMIYPDPPGTTSATLHRINDLSLKVTSPGGTVYNGNVGLSAANWSTAGGSPNTIDTVENVFVQNPQAGTWTLEVRAAEVNQDAHLSTPAADAVFSLVATVGGVAAPAVCGNGVREGSEQCDSPDLGGQTCQSQGFSGGTLSCNGDCTFNTSGCSVCLLVGASCSSNGQCCSNRCKGAGGGKTCR